MMKNLRLRQTLSLAGLLLAALALLLFPELASRAVTQGLSLCGAVILPSLFPFFVCAELFSALSLVQLPSRLFARVMRPVFHLSGEGGAALVLGFLGGYPSGAQSAARLFEGGALSKREAERLLLFCNNAGPAFIVGVLGSGVFQSVRIGFLLWAVHVLGALLSGILLRPKQSPEKASASKAPLPSAPVSFAAAFTASVRRAGGSALSVCAFVVIFSVLSAFLRCLLPEETPQWLQALLVGMLELSNGTALLPSNVSALPLAAFLLGFSGLGVWAQAQSLLAGTELDFRAYLPAKLLHGGLSAVLAWLCSLLPAVRAEAIPAFGAQMSFPKLLFLPLWGLAGAICLCFRKMMGRNSAAKRV